MEYVIKRNGEKATFQISKIREVINWACKDIDVNPLKLESSITSKFKNNIKTSDIQDILIQTCTSLASIDEPEWSLVAGRLVIYNLSRNIYKQTGYSYETNFSEFFEYMIRNGYYDKSILNNINIDDLKKLHTYINPNNDNDYNIGSALSLVKKYLVKNQRGTLELPQFADMSVSVFLNQKEENFISETIKDYKMISQKIISLATPFKTNLRKPNANLSSCFILEIDDNIESIMKSYTDMALISKNGGGVGVYLGKIRPENSLIKGTPSANVINKWIKIINDIAVAVNQLGTRKGAITPALDVWHLDLEEFIELKTEVGDLRLKAFDVYPQVVLNNKFIEAVKNDLDWYLLDRQEVQKVLNIDLTNPNEFNNNYNIIIENIKNNKITHYKKTSAKKLWKRLLTVYIETGDLYMCNKDNMNLMNPMIDAEEFIQCGNLCQESFSPIKASTNFKTEIKDGIVYNSFKPNLIHTCNLVSLNLTKILNNEKLLESATRRAVRILDKAIDVTEVPIFEGQQHNQFFRTIGIGTLGTADWMAYNKLSYNKEEDWIELEKLYEKISYYAFDESANLAQEKGSFEKFNESNFSKGILLGRTAQELQENSKANLDWISLADKTSKGIRNMLLVALAPNTSTAVTMGASASYLPIFNKFYNESMDKLNVPVSPEFLKNRFWYYNEGFTVPTENIIRLTNKLQYWIDTGISMELIINPELTNIKKISDALLECFSQNLKTVYYSRTIDLTSSTKEVSCVSCAN